MSVSLYDRCFTGNVPVHHAVAPVFCFCKSPRYTYCYICDLFHLSPAFLRPSRLTPSFTVAFSVNHLRALSSPLPLISLMLSHYYHPRVSFNEKIEIRATPSAPFPYMGANNEPFEPLTIKTSKFDASHRSLIPAVNSKRIANRVHSKRKGVNYPGMFPLHPYTPTPWYSHRNPSPQPRRPQASSPPQQVCCPTPSFARHQTRQRCARGEGLGLREEVSAG